MDTELGQHGSEAPRGDSNSTAKKNELLGAVGQPGALLPTAGGHHHKKSRKWLRLAVLSTLTVAALSGLLIAVLMSKPAPSENSNATVLQPATAKPTPAASVASLTLDPKKNYGDKYADGILPVGDKKFVTDKAKKGQVYACPSYAKNISAETAAGAGTRGPWFTANNQSYDINKKSRVAGNVTWQSNLNVALSGSTRTITSNALPTHATGTYPVASNDPAYAYDRNPNTIKAQSLSYSLPSSPAYGTPNCMGGQSGIMLTGSTIFNGFDAGGRDAGAWEVQDGCSGHPEKSGNYHYHTLSSCITDVSISKVIGFALDGFPITGPKLGDKNILTTDDLDECHGITSEIILDGKPVTTYHYVMTQDFPYSVSCFRAKPAQTQPTAAQSSSMDPAGPARPGTTSVQPAP